MRTYLFTAMAVGALALAMPAGAQQPRPAAPPSAPPSAPAPVGGLATIRISTGGESGAYHSVVCAAIKQHIESRQAGRFRVECVTSAGSGQNLERVEKGEVQAGLMQFDVLSAAYAARSELQEKIAAIGNLGPEALWCVGAKNGRVKTVKPLMDTEKPEKPYRIVVGPETSGTALTWNFLRNQSKELRANVELVTLPVFNHTTAYGRVRAGIYDLVCFVQAPNPANERITEVVNSDDLFFVPMNDPNWTGYQINGNAPYVIVPAQFKGPFTVAAVRGADDANVLTIHTRATLILNDTTMPPAMFNALKAAVLDPELLPASSASGIAQRKFYTLLAGTRSAAGSSWSYLKGFLP